MLDALSGKWAAGGDYHLTATTTNTSKITFTGTAAGDFQIFRFSDDHFSLETTSDTLGVLDTTVRLLAAGAIAVEGTNGGDSATVQGSISLSSSKLFSVTSLH